MIPFLLSLALTLSTPFRVSVASVEPDTPEEITFLKVCWYETTDNHFIALYPSNGMVESMFCLDPEEPRWPNGSTVRVKFDDGTSEKTKVATRAALAQWNMILGVEFFVETRDSWDVLVQDMPTDSDRGSLLASARHFKEAGHLAGNVVVYPLARKSYDTKQLSIVQLHEFGHILGLHHDVDNPKSLMYPSYGDSQLLTPADRDALVKRYGKVSN